MTNSAAKIEGISIPTNEITKKISHNAKKNIFVPKMKMNHSQILKHKGDRRTDRHSLPCNTQKEFIIRIAYIYKYIYPILIMGSMCTSFVRCVCLSVLDNPTDRQSLQFIFSQSAKLKL